MQDLSIFNSKTMSTKDIAELTGKEHKHILRDTRSMLEQLGIAGPDLVCPINQGVTEVLRPDNGQVQEYLLNEEMSLTLVSGYNVQLRFKIVQRWKQLETAAQSIQASTAEKALDDMRAIVAGIGYVADHHTIVGYGNVKKLRMDNPTASSLGRKAAALSRQKGYEIFSEYVKTQFSSFL